jgi:hypothetical protein
MLSPVIDGFTVALASELPGGEDAGPHADTHAAGGTDELTPAMIGAAEEEHTHDLADITDAGARGRVTRCRRSHGLGLPSRLAFQRRRVTG